MNINKDVFMKKLNVIDNDMRKGSYVRAINQIKALQRDLSKVIINMENAN